MSLTRDQRAENGARVRFLAGDEKRAYIAGFHDGALDATRAAQERGLDVAWRECEAALPEGWVIDGLRRIYDFGMDTGKFVARATQPESVGPTYIASPTMPLMQGTGHTPEGALDALIAALIEKRSGAES